ncbi:MAG: RnfABCDGE type electron transport complex subunit D [Lentisphaerae bacterium]|jgi:Na+-transporting NADH:ubiquinone oxidoreductase subunit B|nr:RnfABCDGE type electron transport complex subunit D [Lentisphaerota bacterium]MBT4820513.1 RnfABCDGE type electron transport complex subunit D [Lentisphaerota bacterium]MBT5608107.1 RnfABCDGE type electron transport complex subunit D [Lentisphaerota bacterium]MBT7060616.1 RnfABCDGE type electron transport complex subunit D [Lentisphaerota bacterium]MBT7847715.1 RnfABCDGE type electron transport complex subunit D [Lentisphaerota bacterium]
MPREAPGKRALPSSFKAQKMMRRVVLALMPALVGGVYFFGWRVLGVCVCVLVVGLGTEFGLARRRGDPLTESAIVTCLLLALSLPPTIPFWIAAVGAVVALSFGKELFGGFGRNVFNPAIVGRAFLYVCFPEAMTKGFVPVYTGGLGGLRHWFPSNMDAVSAATPMWVLRDYGHETPFLRLLTGSIGGTFSGPDGTMEVLGAGSIGEVSAILVAIGGIYLLLTKTAQWRLALSSLVGAAAAAVFFRHVLGAQAVPPVHWVMCAGGMLYACFFMVTDPVSAPNHKPTQFLYGAFIGVLIVFFRWKAAFAGGVGFAILMGNTVGPSLEIGLKAWEKKRKTASKREARP